MRKSILLVGVLVLAAGCAQPGGTPVSGTIEVTAVDYSFEGVPALVAPGAEFTLTNGADTSVHEMVIVRLVDGETRTLEEILALPEEESDALIAEFAGGLFALPGETGESFEDASTSVTVKQPGRYAIVCFMPEGIDQATFEEAMASGEEELGGGTPHALLGMVAEFTVEEA